MSEPCLVLEGRLNTCGWVQGSEAGASEEVSKAGDDEDKSSRPTRVPMRRYIEVMR